ncbi:IPT/TIG domain-containing protein [Mucilaginibacter phyllosphaerae]|uniref:IPT/TIG domain-containing protein n=1 Tax=Mucilaginibacter phyllosphaerae TaxID=1812349 RepID=A0A4Y8AFT5_9SPHI|nr:IPT/TIG domain-containing protein [Mucilaginibacter phyllosphaerae]MBB3968737.1 hypothetical protein [Mucilaginibacter phyllosphaerae]TEW67628.1 hypothetical protein E2R65_06460 [Mucilaginibacter phyllosphaerae]GGH14183.1 hypothetical protein GCM10007352_22130 [Mucilaginibacter phyllosphaerae]
MFKRLLFVIAVAFFVNACKKDAPESKLPSVNPVQGTVKADWGDTITITGNNLPTDTKVRFGENTAVVVSNNGKELRCIVPVSIADSITTTVYLQYNGQTVGLKDYVTLNAPVITSFTPTQAIGDTVVIKGAHFNYFRLLVKFGNADARVVSWSKSQLKVLVPDEIKSIHSAISVTSQVQTVVASNPQFEVLKPVITSVTPEAFIGDEIVIKGKYFHPLGPFAVTLDGKPAGASVTDNGTISFKLPYQAYPGRKTTVKVKLLEYEVTYPVDIKIKNNWVLVHEGLPFSAYYATPLTVGANVYLVAPLKNSNGEGVYLWRFNQADFSWTRVGNMLPDPGDFRVGTNGRKIYLYNSLSATNFYECEPSNGTWIARANYSGPARRESALFSLGGKIYLGAGYHYIGNDRKGLDDWYVYTPGANSWLRIADMRTGYEDNYPMSSAATVVINNEAYVLCGGWFYDYKYNPVNDKWTALENMMEPRRQAGVVVYKNKIYTIKGFLVQNVGNSNRDIFSFDPAANHWAYEPVDINPFDDELNVAFTVGGKIYMLSYDSSEFRNNLYEAISLP